MVQLLAVIALLCTVPAKAAYLYQDPSATVADRAADLLSRLNNTEKKVKTRWGCCEHKV
jgi:ABC-type transporter MlaC component